MVNGFDEISPLYTKRLKYTYRSCGALVSNTNKKMNYVGPAPDVSYNGVDQMHESERKAFLSKYENVARSEVFDNRRVMQLHCQADMTGTARGVSDFCHFLQIGNMEMFLESMTITSACKRSFCKKFLQPDRIGIIPVESYMDNRSRARSASCPNCRIHGWKASVRKLVSRMSLWGATGAVTRACRFEIRLPHARATTWP
jgi:hypothetical protein